jgi:hypothetical protein
MLAMKYYLQFALLLTYQVPNQAGSLGLDSEYGDLDFGGIQDTSPCSMFRVDRQLPLCQRGHDTQRNLHPVLRVRCDQNMHTEEGRELEPTRLAFQFHNFRTMVLIFHFVDEFGSDSSYTFQSEVLPRGPFFQRYYDNTDSQLLIHPREVCG